MRYSLRLNFARQMNNALLRCQSSMFTFSMGFADN